MAELFPTDFVAAVSRMRLSAGQAPRGGRHAEHGSVQLGAGMEFRDFRSYMPGDDIRRIDWNLYRRSGRLFLRLFEEERDLPVGGSPLVGRRLGVFDGRLFDEEFQGSMGDATDLLVGPRLGDDVLAKLDSIL